MLSMSAWSSVPEVPATALSAVAEASVWTMYLLPGEERTVVLVSAIIYLATAYIFTVPAGVVVPAVPAEFVAAPLV